MKIQLNIGLLAGLNGKAYDIGRAMATAAYYFNPKAMRAERQVAESGEETAVIEVESDIHPGAVINSMCAVLDQDCIAFKLDGAGFLIGPKTEPYGGAFNADYWLSPSWGQA